MREKKQTNKNNIQIHLPNEIDARVFENQIKFHSNELHCVRHFMQN